MFENRRGKGYGDIMRPVVYIDILFILNFLIDFILLYVTAYICKRRARLWRLTLGAALGALYSCLMFFPRVVPVVTVVGKLICSAVLVALSLNTWKPAKLLRAYAVFWMVSAAFGGMVFAFAFFTNAGVNLGAVVSNGEFYMQISGGTLALAVLFSYAGIFAFTKLCRKNFAKDKIILSLRLTRGGKTVKIRALIDTGCELCDPLDGRPVMIVWQGAAERLLDRESRRKLTEYQCMAAGNTPPCSEWSCDEIRMLPFSSVGAEKGFLPAVRVDSAQDMGGKYRIDGDFFMGIVPFPLSENGIYDAVLNPDILIQEGNTQIGVTENVQKIYHSVSNEVVSVEVPPRTAAPEKGALYRGRRGSAAASVEGGGADAHCVSCAGREHGTNSSDFN